MGTSVCEIYSQKLKERSRRECLFPSGTLTSFRTFLLQLGSWFQVNRNKKSLGLSFKDPAGVEILHRLAETSDILVENYLPGTLKKYHMDYKTIHSLNPRYWPALKYLSRSKALSALSMPRSRDTVKQAPIHPELVTMSWWKLKWDSCISLESATELQ